MVGPLIMFCDKMGPNVLGRIRADDKLAILTIRYTKCFELIAKGIYCTNFFCRASAPTIKCVFLHVW